jgi:hypothetical protein
MPTMIPAVLVEGGNTLTFAAAAADDDIDVSSLEVSGKPAVLYVKCGATGTTVTIPVASPNTSAPGLGRVTKPTISEVIPANGERYIEIGPIGPYKSLTTGRVPVQYTSLVTVVRAVFSL